MAKVLIQTGRSGFAWPVLLDDVRNYRLEGRRILLYVPEQMTLQTERDLITDLDLEGLLDLDVISPKKLRMLVRERAGGSDRKMLSESGQIMAVHRAMKDADEDMRFYQHMTDLPGAVERIREGLNELRESEITPEETEEYAGREEIPGAVKAKLLDLNRVRDAYESLVSEHFDDEKSAWTDTVQRLEKSGLMKNAAFLVYGFDTVRPDLRELLCTAAKLASEVRVIITCDLDSDKIPDRDIFSEANKSLYQLSAALKENGAEMVREHHAGFTREACEDMLRWLEKSIFDDRVPRYKGYIGDAVSLYAASDRVDEAEQTAVCLLGWHAMGIPWDRMAVALPGNTPLEGIMRSRLRLNGIPFYAAENRPAAAHGVCRMLTASLECITEGYPSEQVTEAAMSRFCVLEAEEARTMTEYAEAHGIEGTRWQQPFTYGADAEAAEAARRKFIAPIETLRKDLKDAETATQSVEAVIRFLEAEGAGKRLQERQELLLEKGLYSQAVTDARVWKLLSEMLEQLWTLLGERRCAIRDLKNMLESALDNATVTVLPETESGVVLGEVGHLQAGDMDAVILAGCQEGILTAPESGWLADRDREKLHDDTGYDVGLTRTRRNAIRKYDYYRTMTAPSRFLRLSWSLQDEGGGPLQESGLIARIRGIFPEIRTAGGIRGTEEIIAPRTPLKAMETAGQVLDGKQEGNEKEGTDASLVSLLYSGSYGRTARVLIGEAKDGERKPVLTPETAAELFRTDVVSISRLERYASCPYRHFIDYGLRPVETETYEYDSADTGTFLHAALDRYLKTAGSSRDWPNLDDRQVDGIMDGICAELTEEWEGTPLREDALGIWQGEDTLRRVYRAAHVLTRFAANSDFRTIATEQSFGKSGGLPPMELRLKDGSKVTVQGVIDRIDTYENGEGLWLRVVDNKSSGKKPEPAKMEDGEQLQLMIYLKAATAAFPGARPAGAFFFPVQDAEINAEETPEALEAERMKKARMKGLVNAREDVVRAMDRDLKPYSVDEVFTKNGDVRKGADWAVEEDVLRGLMAAAEEKAAEICGGIREGRIDVRPRGKSEEDAPCRFCNYRTLCRRNRDSLTPRKEETTFRSLAGKNTLREAEK